ncbi:hypothetical protein IV203_019412 [Nitzschia inconspicua]|uniref:BZIP domain-containing protein n=1 Tax=Nitzschia inconspicua TaxID=303405 RepID=A0A9K3Q494_9STRA|nr:hypothetical protein IV203_019412 [Nitzschia inconspicua]
MSPTIEWSQVESSMQDISPTSDLFDGDILGDELMDIYNAAVVGGGDDDAMHEIPALLGPQAEDGVDDTEDVYGTHPGAQVADAAAAMDDGFGAFRPSTSFNDLSNLYESKCIAPSSAAAPGTAPSQPLAPVVSCVSIAQAPAPIAPAAPSATKRKSISSGTPPAKRRNSSAGKKNGSVAPKKKATGSPKANLAKESKNDTPDPLKADLIPAPVISTSTKAVAPVKPVANGVSAAPPVVTPAATDIAPAPSQHQTAVANSEGSPPSIVTASVMSMTHTEADFKNVAQAAVSNLIMNVTNGQNEPTKPSSEPPTENVDTSTDHVKALTGSNWVSVCAGSDSSITSNQACNDKQNNRSRRQNLTPDERARQNRDRNREHARNTRLRKKAYVEELKRTLTALVAQRDASELEKRHTSHRELEQREVRFRVTEEFLKLRGRNEANHARWAAILEDNFTLTLPLTDFRNMVHSGESEQKFEQVLTGVSEVMSDSNLCSAFLQGLGKGHNGISLAYNCDRKNFFMDNCIAMLEFTASSHGATQQGAVSELVVKGNVRAKFSPASNKLISVVMTFDTGAIVSQVNQIMSASVHDMDAAVEAAQVAANEADAILDSLQMPHIAPSIPSKINVVPPSSGSTTGSSICEKEESSDGSDKEE